MKIAVAQWNDRVAPVFDVARHLDLIEVERGSIVAETFETLPETQPLQKAAQLAAMGIDALICGAISSPVQDMVEAYGIAVYPFVAGDLAQVKSAWLSNGLRGSAFAMPGCGRGRRCRSRSRGGHRCNGANRRGG